VNGDLIAAAEAEGFDLLLTTDKNMRYQQNLTGRKIAFVVLGNQQWPTLRRYVERVVAAVDAATQLFRSGDSVPTPPRPAAVGESPSFTCRKQGSGQALGFHGRVNLGI
jgi:hypothetical protein